MLEIEAAPMAALGGERKRNLAAFWLLGLLNNSGEMPIIDQNQRRGMAPLRQFTATAAACRLPALVESLATSLTAGTVSQPT